MKQQNLLPKETPFTLGIDIGSTTAKAVLIRDGVVIFKAYERHFSMVREKTMELLVRIKDLVGEERLHVAISGSAGLGLASSAEIPFVQEVFATSMMVETLVPDTNVVVELGGEDAKIIFFDGGLDERMNGSCAGGTGAFIDQMATLLHMTADEMDACSLAYTKTYPIASRCGVFAKTDIQPLINQGAAKADIAASIFQAVVNQTVAGLAQGRRIKGKVMFLGGPLFYCQGLRNRFVKTLELREENAIFPDYALYSVALGSAIYASKQPETFGVQNLLDALQKTVGTTEGFRHTDPLFDSVADYENFQKRHDLASVPTLSLEEYTGDAYLGIDCGSTTTKMLLIDPDNRILYTYYHGNEGNPVDLMREQLLILRRLCGDRVRIAGSAVTGYGEELITRAFRVDAGLVETMAHLGAAKHFNPHVDFIIDIGGQDMKCFRVKNGAIDSILLNEACSSGCGSFLETFAKSLGYPIETFAKMGLYAKAPVELGSRCTVFMNSSVKQAQKDGASVEDISAGLSMSVVKNAIYKVIRVGSAHELGSQVVVQGGTFLNDAVLRSFERELGIEVIRPNIAGLMGAYGAALYAKSLGLTASALLSESELVGFEHQSTVIRCKQCANQCALTINRFSTGEKFISGNKCERGAGGDTTASDAYNMYAFKRKIFASLTPKEGRRGAIGMPLGLGMYDLAPFWYALFTNLGFAVHFSGPSSHALYTKGQYTIPSDTVCYPAKLMHGHIEKLIEEGITTIFYPSLTYNIDEKDSHNHYNCPVVAYYSEIMQSNIEGLADVTFLYPYLNINKPSVLAESLRKALTEKGFVLTKSEMKEATRLAYLAMEKYHQDLHNEGERILGQAKKDGKRVLVLAGRPYHVDTEVCHNIDQLATSLGFAVVSEDGVDHLAKTPSLAVLNQWTYHARLYRSAVFASENEGVELVQLVSFGCGIDAITGDEIARILRKSDKLYTQIKIDEISNLGAVRIRLRSLLGALDARVEEAKQAETKSEKTEGGKANG